uniref:Uncharacterized protein n=1 Tax=Ciona savignyi TaxID=51511 RepID=H2YX50_CIOSA
MSSSEDEMPEGISFERSRVEELSKRKSLKDDMQREKERKKFLQKDRERRNIAQKEHKMLSIDVLKEADDSIKREESRKRKMNETNISKLESEDSLAKMEQESGFMRISKTKTYCKPLSKEAVDFRTDHLYNGRIRRVDYKQLQNQNRKLMASSR